VHGPPACPGPGAAALSLPLPRLASAEGLRLAEELVAAAGLEQAQRLLTGAAGPKGRGGVHAARPPRVVVAGMRQVRSAAAAAGVPPRVVLVAADADRSVAEALLASDAVAPGAGRVLVCIAGDKERLGLWQQRSTAKPGYRAGARMGRVRHACIAIFPCKALQGRLRKLEALLES